MFFWVPLPRINCLLRMHTGAGSVPSWMPDSATSSCPNKDYLKLACLRPFPYEKCSPDGCTLLQARCVHRFVNEGAKNTSDLRIMLSCCIWNSRMLDYATFVGSNVFTPEIMNNYVCSSSTCWIRFRWFILPIYFRQILSVRDYGQLCMLHLYLWDRV